MKYNLSLALGLLFNAAWLHANTPDATVPPEPPIAAKAIEKPTPEAMRALAKSICDGDKKAFDVLCATATELYRDIDIDNEPERNQNNYKLMRAAFDLLGQEAAKGKALAFDALKAALSQNTPHGFAVLGMGIAAAGGHKESLDILLRYDEHRISQLLAVDSLMEPAAANIEPAVAVLIRVIRNPDDKPLHWMASEGLKGAAQKGNAQAKAALDEYARAHPKAEDQPAIPVTLKVGDLAPKLSVGQWVQGEPVQAFEKDKVYLVEFWATWCGPCVASIPHLNEIHEKYKDKGLAVIGQNVWEKEPARVQAFVAKRGDKMSYRVALDDVSKSKDGAMAETWMLASGQGGIPTAFLVGKDGKISWIGHPMELKDAMIEEVISKQ
jgi:thiol-disulfide isomerase/thioredoxin